MNTTTPPMLPSRPRQSVFNETYRNKHREKYYEKKKAQKLARASQ